MGMVKLPEKELATAFAAADYIHCIIYSTLMCENFLKPASRRCARRKGRVHPWRQDKEPAGG